MTVRTVTNVLTPLCWILSSATVHGRPILCADAEKGKGTGIGGEYISPIGRNVLLSVDDMT
jgi:hypothetical protein